jgi:hypothetical protein
MTDTPSIPPALTVDEWTDLLRTDNEELEGCDADEIAEDLERRRESAASWHADYKRYHKAAAVCLYGQPFGFTQDDVDTLDALYGMALNAIAERGDLEDATVPPRAWTVIAKIEALLPPK